MEYNFRLAEIFPDKVSIVGNDLIPKDCPGLNRTSPQIVKSRVTEIMDSMGKASAVAQELHTIITNAERLRTSDQQRVYILSDFESNQVVGLLKVGHKKLFIFDDKGTQHEMHCPCILDFYVHESRQRQGYGKDLFEYMLHVEGVPVQHFAIDRPSDKLLFFLKKHYGLYKIIRQVNNFVVFDSFFENRSDYAGHKPKWGGLDQAPDLSLRQKSRNMGMCEDSSGYNSQTQLHLRNGQLLPNQVSRRHDSSIGNVLQPNGAGLPSKQTPIGDILQPGRGHYNNHAEPEPYLEDEHRYVSVPNGTSRRFCRPDLKFNHHSLW